MAERNAMLDKIRCYVTESVQRLEIFTDIEICTKRDLDLAHEKMDNRLNRMNDSELQELCNRIDKESECDTYYSIFEME